MDKNRLNGVKFENWKNLAFSPLDEISANIDGFKAFLSKTGVKS